MRNGKSLTDRCSLLKLEQHPLSDTYYTPCLHTHRYTHTHTHTHAHTDCNWDCKIANFQSHTIHSASPSVLPTLILNMYACVCVCVRVTVPGLCQCLCVPSHNMSEKCKTRRGRQELHKQLGGAQCLPLPLCREKTDHDRSEKGRATLETNKETD